MKNEKYKKTRCHGDCVDLSSKNHQRALDAMQQNLELESRNKVEAMRVKKKLEQDINDLEMTLDGVNKAKAETERNFKKYQQQIRDLQQVVQLQYLYFYPRDAMLARVIAIATCPSVRPSVCPSVTRRYCVKTKKASGMISSPSSSPKTLVF